MGKIDLDDKQSGRLRLPGNKGTQAGGYGMSVIGGLDRALDSTKITAFQSTIIGLCALMAMIDGMDTQAIGLVAPAIAADWHVPAAAFGPVFGSSLFSGLIGALVVGQAGDRFGRKPVLIFSVLVVAVGSLATPFTPDR